MEVKCRFGVNFSLDLPRTELLNLQIAFRIRKVLSRKRLTRNMGELSYDVRQPSFTLIVF